MYRELVLDEWGTVTQAMEDDPHCLAALKHYRSLMPLAQEAHKPDVLKLVYGACGGHAKAVQDCYSGFPRPCASCCSPLWIAADPLTYKGKLIEAALPLGAINAASARGTLSTAAVRARCISIGRGDRWPP